jgi:CBS domain-containing protein
MAVPIHHLMQDQPPLVTIAPGATLQEAVAQMIEHDFTQLPVVEKGRPYGNPASFVSSNSIARALRVFSTTLETLRVRDAVIPARTISVDEDLFAKMDDLLESAVLVLSADGTIAGIITNYDTTQYFRRRAEDILLVEDIETTLKDHVRIAYGGEEADPQGALQTAINALGGPIDSVKEECRKSFRRFCGQKGYQVTDAEVYESVVKPFERTKGERRFDDLTLNEYIQLARRDEAWDVLNPVFGIPDRAFLEMLEGVRKTRNKLMHFRPDITPLERDRLRFCADWFKNHPPASPEDDSGAEVVHVIVPGPDQDVSPPAAGPIEYIEDSTADADRSGYESTAVDSKYAPLAAFLSQQPRSQERIDLSFSDVETIIGAPLPAAARNHRAWWANDATMHVQSEQWLKVNWRVVSINMTKERVTFARARDREQAYIRFFSAVQNRLREISGFPLHQLNPLGLNWLTIASYPREGWNLVVSFARGQRLRLECYIDTGEAVENEAIFERLLEDQAAIQSAVGTELEWERLPGKRACRVALYTKGSVTDGPEQLSALIEWTAQHAPPFHQALGQTLRSKAETA